MPFDLEFVTLSKREHIELRQQASQFRSLHKRAVTRMQSMQCRHDREMAKAREQQAQLKAALVAAQAQIRDLRQRVFGAKTEQSRSINATGQVVAPKTARRARGQQRGRPGHGRTRLDWLPARQEHLRLQEAVCPGCGLPMQEITGTQDAEVLEIEVKAYRRVVRRHRYRPACDCGCTPGLVMPSVPAALIERGKLGVSIWVEALLSKFLYGQPTRRLLQDWADQGLVIAQGTLTDGLHTLLPLLKPLAEASLVQLRRSAHWHADETRWEVFEEREGKIGHRWYLWVFKSEQVVCFVLDPSRSASVPMAALDGAAGVLSVDRYASYRKFARQTPGMHLAICWAHQRRDFLRVANDHPGLWAWAMGWVQQIGQLYRLHAQRREHAGDMVSEGFVESDTRLRALLAAMSTQCDTELSDAQLAEAARKVLRTLRSYWPGLVRFLDHPFIDLDNNAAERALRPAVAGRKNYYGSGSQWSGELAATMLGVFATVRLWGINPRIWLRHYLQACVDCAGRPPADLSSFLPWTMDAERLAAMRARTTFDSS